MHPPRRILILACSKKKSLSEEPLPALERYDGPAYRVLRSYLRTIVADKNQPPDIFVLSARFGLISSSELIPAYDELLTNNRVAELRLSVQHTLKELLTNRGYSKAFISAGKTYLAVLDGYEKMLAPSLSVQVAEGPPGQRLAELKDWLFNGQLPGQAPAARIGTAQIHGQTISLQPEHVLHIGREALRAGNGSVQRYYSWYVEIDGQRVAPKWLVSQITGLSVSQFSTSQAKRVLEQIGVKVIHT